MEALQGARPALKPGMRYFGRKIVTRTLKMEDELSTKYPHNVSFYEDPPDFTVSLLEFEKLAIERLKFLRSIERENSSSSTKFSVNWVSHIMHSCQQLQLTNFYNLMNRENLMDRETLYEARKADHISHYLLRLAFCKTPDQRKWFISLEVDFFQYQFLKLKYDEALKFLKSHGIVYELVSESEKKELKDKLAAVAGNLTDTVTQLDYYKVPFSHALDLVRTRRVVLVKGNAYVPIKDLSSIVAAKFRSSLSLALSVIKKQYHVVEEDDRLVRILNDFDKNYTGSDYLNVSKNEGITADMFPQLADRSFPLCMKSLYGVLVKEHHLKHWGRLQLGLFFKGLGAPLNETVKFFRSEFTKKGDMDSSRFDKQYLYNLRHMYGKEGKRTDYTPYSCLKIINSSVGPGESHGCPFKHSDEMPLKTKLQQAKITNEGVTEILALVKDHNYQLACQKYFEYTHDLNTVDGGVHHPNQFFEESEKILSGRKTIKKEKNRFANPKTVVYGAESCDILDSEQMDIQIEPNGPSHDKQLPVAASTMEFDGTLDDETAIMKALESVENE